MKVLFLNAYGNGSTGRIVDSLKEECQKNGIEALSVYAREFCNSPESSIRCFNKIDFYCDALFTRIFDNHGLNSILNTRRIISIIDNFNPDIIHIHNLHGYWINYEMLFKYIKNENIKVVWTFHDCWSFTGHCTHFDYIGCEKWKSGCELCQQIKEYPASILRDNSKYNYKKKKKSFTGLNCCVLVTPSKWLKKKAEESFFKEYTILTINNGVNIEIFKPIKSDRKLTLVGMKYSALILAVAGDWNPRKGLSYIVEMAKAEPEWLVVVVGNVVDNSQISGIENIVHIERTEDTHELAELYSISDVFVNPTLEDTYPTTNLEAIACGTPVVTFPTGGSPEIVQETGYGIVTSERNSDVLVKAVKDLLTCKKNMFRDINALDSRLKFNQYIELYRKIKDGVYD